MSDSWSTSLGHAVQQIVGSVIRCIIMMLAQNICQCMWILRLKTGDKQLPFASSLTATKISDTDKSDNCSMGLHHAEKQMPEHIVRWCMTMILSQHCLQWMWFLGLQTGDNFHFALSWTANAIPDKDRSDNCSSGWCLSLLHISESPITY